jgi:RNA polymerase sigma-70 factor (ECF subfamily)
MNRELTELIDGCKRNQAKAQEILYKKFSGLTYGVCLRYAGNSFDAEDVMQEGWVKVFKHIDMYSTDNSFEGWLRRIMINTAITQYRRNLKHAYQEDVEQVTWLEGADDGFVGGDFSREELLKAINKLPNGYRMVFNMYVVEGYRHKEIADMLEIDINTSKSQLSRAKKVLQRELELMSAVNLQGTR